MLRSPSGERIEGTMFGEDKLCNDRFELSDVVGCDCTEARLAGWADGHHSLRVF